MRARIGVAVALTLAAYVGCVFAGYVWDDRLLIVQNEALRAPDARRLVGSDLWCCTGEVAGSGYWRPLTTLSFFADVQLAGYRPAFAHLHSLLWHLGATALVGVLVRGRHGEARGAAAALMVGLHPVLSEAVVWIAARNDLIAAVFVLGALVAADRRRPAVVGACALAAALSKESSFVLPGMLVAWTAAHGGGRAVRQAWRSVAASAAGLGLALALRPLAALGPAATTDPPPLDAAHLGAAAARMLGWLAWPWPLTGTATLYLPAPTPQVWAAAGATCVALGLLVARAPARGLALLAMSALAALPLGAALAVYATVGERYLYLPMVGVAALVATAAPSGRASGAALAVWAVGALVAVHVRLADWVDTRTWFEAATRRAPDAVSWNLYGVELGRDWERAAALDAFERSIAARPAQRFACRNVVVAARAVEDAAGFAARVPGWRAAGCSQLPAFEPSVAWSLALLGDLPAALDVLDAAGPDGTGVTEALRATEAARGGDVLAAAGWIAASADPAGSRERFATLAALGR